MKPGTARAEVAILGGGVAGITCAHYLTAAGREVVVIDRQPAAGLGASFANGGLITPSMSDPWAAPGVPGHLLRWLGNEQAPLLLRLRAIPGMLGWGLRFLANCRDAPWRAGTEITLRLADYSRDALDALSDDIDIEYARLQAGALRIFRDTQSVDDGMRLADLHESLGIRCVRLDRDGCIALEPSLAPTAAAIRAGVHYPDDRSGDAHVFTQRLAATCEAAGTRFRWNSTVERLEREGDAVTAVVTDSGTVNADFYVMALGAHSPLLAREIGLKLPVYPVKGYSVTLPIGQWPGAPRLPLMDQSQKMGITPLGGLLRLAGTAEFDGYRADISAARCDALVAAARRTYPDLPVGPERRDWAGLRPMTPDCRPIIGRTPLANLLLDTGHGALGWTLAAGSGRIVTDLIEGRDPEIDLSGLTLDRYR